MSYSNVTSGSGVVNDAGFAPPLSHYWLCDTDSSGTVNATFIFFDMEGNALASGAALTATLPPAVPTGKMKICNFTGYASILNQDFPAGAVGALMTLDGAAYCSTSEDSPAGTASDWRIEANTLIPLGTVPDNLGITGALSPSGGGGGGVQYTEGTTDATIVGTVALVEGAGNTVETLRQYAEDAAHTSGDRGVMALAVRADTAAATAADGDYHPLLVDSTGALHVNAGTGGRIAKDLFDTEATFTISTGSNALAVNCGATAAQVDFTDADGNAPSAIKVFASFAGNTGLAVGAGEHIDLYWVNQDENVAPFSQAGGGTTDAALNAANTLIALAGLQAHYLGSAYFQEAGTSKVATWSGIIEHPGPRGTIFYHNASAQALAASGSYIRYRPIHTEAV